MQSPKSKVSDAPGKHMVIRAFLVISSFGFDLSLGFGNLKFQAQSNDLTAESVFSGYALMTCFRAAK
jgi:hypothetical protein